MNLGAINTIILGLTGFILGITALIICKYTRAAQQSNEMRIRPVLNLYLRDNKDKLHLKECFALRNIGEGTAYNIIVENIEIENYVCKFFFEQPNIILEPLKDEKRLEFYVEMPDNSITDRDIPWFKNFFAPETLEKDKIEKAKKEFATFLVHYKNIAAKDFYSIFKFYAKHPATSEFVVEFIKSDEGMCTMEKAHRLCQSREKIKSTYESRIKKCNGFLDKGLYKD